MEIPTREKKRKYTLSDTNGVSTQDEQHYSLLDTNGHTSEADETGEQEPR